jgi:hypothetical protein
MHSPAADQLNEPGEANPSSSVVSPATTASRGTASVGAGTLV